MSDPLVVVWSPPRPGHQRHVFALLGFLGLCNAYAMRVNLAVAIVAMTNGDNNNKNSSHVPSDVCPTPNETVLEPILTSFSSALSSSSLLSSSSSSLSSSSSSGSPQFDWDAKTQGVVLGSFYYGYILTQLPGGLLAERIGGKWVFGPGIFATAILTLLTPLASKTNVVALIVVRALEGLFEGVTFPSMNAMLAQWAPPEERTRMSTAVYMGGTSGTIVAMTISGWMCEQLGWEAVFYLSGLSGVIWFALWTQLVYNSPSEHPRISLEERQYIETSLHHNNAQPRSRKPPWKAIFTSTPLLGLCVAHVAQNWGFYTLLNELPTYMNRILHFKIKEDALLSSIPYAVMTLTSLLSSVVADWMLSLNIMKTGHVRKLFSSLAFFGPSIGFVLLTFARCNTLLVVIFLCMTTGFNGLTSASIAVNHLDIAPNYAGTLLGITNGLANTMGFVSPYVIGLIVNEHQDLSHWQTVFLLSSLVYAAGNIVFLLLGSGQVQPFNDYEHYQDGTGLGAFRELDDEEELLFSSMESLNDI